MPRGKKGTSRADHPQGARGHPREHAWGGSGLEEASKPEPPYDAASHPLGEGRQVGRRDRPRGQEHGRSVGPLPKHPVGDARVQVDVAVKGRAEAVDEGDGAEPRARSARRVVVACCARRRE